MLAGFALLTTLAGAQERADWRPAVDTYPMWLRCDMTTKSDDSASAPTKRFVAIHRINGDYDRLSFGYVYGELDSHSRSSLDVLTKEIMAGIGTDPKDVMHRESRDFDFTSFVPGSENGWTKLKARRIGFETNVGNKIRRYDALMIVDGQSRVWTFLTNYAVGYADGPAVADRLLNSIQIMNRIDVGDAQNHYRAAAFPSGKLRKDVTGSYVPKGN